MYIYIYICIGRGDGDRCAAQPGAQTHATVARSLLRDVRHVKVCRTITTRPNSQDTHSSDQQSSDTCESLLYITYYDIIVYLFLSLYIYPSLSLSLYMYIYIYIYMIIYTYIYIYIYIYMGPDPRDFCRGGYVPEGPPPAEDGYCLCLHRLHRDCLSCMIYDSFIVYYYHYCYYCV